MNGVIAVFLLAFVAVSMSQDAHSEYMKKMKEAAPECAKEADVDLKTLMGLDRAEKRKIFDESKKFRCFSKCMSLKAGFINDAGVPQVEKLTEILHLDAAAIEDVKKCIAEVTDTDICEKAYKIKKCMMEKMDKKP